MKKGFTLIEVMVVIVIVGVLAGVGVPKLFGVIAKAKAAEVPVAAGTYISLQNANLHENNGIGSWDKIGYGAPGNGRSEYFEYTGCVKGIIHYDQMEPDMPGWLATSLTGLNSCKNGGTWAVVIDPSGEREIEYRRIISSSDCAALTVNWGEVGTTVEGMCEATGSLHESGTETEESNNSGSPSDVSGVTPADPGTPATSSPSSSQSAESSSSRQGDCDALAEAIKNDNGNKFGWVCVSECGLFAPPGKARNAGFTGGNYLKKKQTGGICEKVEPENPSGNDGNQDGAGGSSENTTIGDDDVNVNGEGNKDESTPGSGVSGEIYGMGGAAGGSTGFVGFGEVHDFDVEKDYCYGDVVDGTCKGNYRSNDECATWSAPKCNNSGKGQGQARNKSNCGECSVWKTSK